MTAEPICEFSIAPRGRFSLSESIDFGFAQRDATQETVMRLGFVLDGYQTQVGVAVTQTDSGDVRGLVTGSTDVAAVERHVARVLSLDVDAAGWDELGEKDGTIGALQAARPGLRPPLFYSVYEALLWSVLSARRPQKQMAVLRDRLALEHGAAFEVANQRLAVMPTPEQLLKVAEFPGLPDVKLRRMHAIAQAALDGQLDTQTLREMDPDVAMEFVQQFEGIGPFYSMLVTVRTLGHTDVLAMGEKRLLTIAGELMGAGRPLTDAEFAKAAEAWKPWRTWATVAFRAAGPRLLDPA